MGLPAQQTRHEVPVRKVCEVAEAITSESSVTRYVQSLARSAHAQGTRTRLDPSQLETWFPRSPWPPVTLPSYATRAMLMADVKCLFSDA